MMMQPTKSDDLWMFSCNARTIGIEKAFNHTHTCGRLKHEHLDISSKHKNQPPKPGETTNM